MLRQPFDKNEAGTSMIELIIAVGLFAIIGLAAAQFFKKMGTSEYEAKAKAAAVSEVNLYFNAMERDFKLRDITAASTSAPICATKCKTFSIDRKVKIGTPDGSMKITYDTQCVAVPASMVSKFVDPITKEKFDFSRAADDKNKGAQGQCFKLANCGVGRYPQMVITMNAPGGVSLPSYPRAQGNVAKFPDLKSNTSAAANVIGAVACAESKMGSSAVGSDRIIIEAAYITAEGQYQVEKREVSIPRSNVAKIQMLPAN